MAPCAKRRARTPRLIFNRGEPPHPLRPRPPSSSRAGSQDSTSGQSKSYDATWETRRPLATSGGSGGHAVVSGGRRSSSQLDALGGSSLGLLAASRPAPPGASDPPRSRSEVRRRCESRMGVIGSYGRAAVPGRGSAWGCVRIVIGVDRELEDAMPMTARRSFEAAGSPVPGW